MQTTGIYVGVIRKVMTMNKSNSIHDTQKDTPVIQALQEALECGIVNMDNVQEQLMASKREQVKKMHPYSITPPSKEGDRWRTNYIDPKGKRKSLRAQSEEELLNKLIPIYFAKSHIDKLTFHDLFDEWLAYKTELADNINTIKRHRQHYNKYFLHSALDKKRLLSIDDIFLEIECNRIIKNYSLTAHEWTNVKTIVKGMFEYAMRKHYIKENPFLNVAIVSKFRQVVRKTGRTETYNSEEREVLFDYLDKMYAETNGTAFLAVRTNFYLGLRVGELVSLKWKDLLEKKKLHVVREEIRDQENNTLSVVEHTKTHTDRFVTVIPNAYLFFYKIAGDGVDETNFEQFCLEHEDEFLFVRNGERLTARQYNYVLEKFAERTGVNVKSSHKVRKTYASMLNAAGVPLDCIREQLGHSNLTTTMHYIFNPLTEDQTYELLTKAL